MPREIRLNAFEMNCVGHQSPGLWAHPRDRSSQYKDLEYWTDLARLLERGRFDGLFIADVLGIYDVLDGNGDAAIRQAAQVPVNDPLALITPMAAVTRHLGFGLTASLSFEHPYPFARRLSTLDHLTKGRIGWNVVTSYLESGARNLGQQAQLDHDRRYDYADEYLPGALQALRRQLGGRRGAPRPSPKDLQRPGQDPRDPSCRRALPGTRHPSLRTVAAAHAGALPGRRVESWQALRRRARRVRVRRRAIEDRAQAGRSPTSASASPRPAAIRARYWCSTCRTVVLGETDAKARAKFDEYRAFVSYEGALALISGWTGIDFGQYRPDQVLRHIHTNAIQSAVEAFSSADPTRTWTVRELADWVGIGGFGPLFVGSPATVADLLQEWVEDTDVDGFNLAYALAHETFSDVVELLVPELQKRGVYKTEYAPGTLREKLFGDGPRLPDSHPAAGYRDLRALWEKGRAQRAAGLTWADGG
ncbi:LLM class flavin-dependent oxidoreductase [Pseudomonas aeruginosa]|nr:LLM class flavin-dependent oxidoreductase [Pseudomonas aeruginosa]